MWLVPTNVKATGLSWTSKKQIGGKTFEYAYAPRLDANTTQCVAPGAHCYCRDIRPLDVARTFYGTYRASDLCCHLTRSRRAAFSAPHRHFLPVQPAQSPVPTLVLGLFWFGMIAGDVAHHAWLLAWAGPIVVVATAAITFLPDRRIASVSSMIMLIVLAGLGLFLVVYLNGKVRIPAGGTTATPSYFLKLCKDVMIAASRTAPNKTRVLLRSHR